VSESVEALAEKVRRGFPLLDNRRGGIAEQAFGKILARLAEAEKRCDAAYQDAASAEHRASLVFESERLEWDKIRKAVEVERDRYRDALRKSAEALHGLSEDPVHLRNIFVECPDHHCVAARAALQFGGG
jgi:hypothetical protein